MFQPSVNHSFTGSGHGGGLLFAPRPPIQRGEGLFSALSSIFRRVAPFLKKGLSTGSKVLKKVANSDVVQDIKKGVGNAAVDITSNLVADLVAGKPHDQATDAANERLQKARLDIANMMRNPSLANTRQLPPISTPPSPRSKAKRNKRKNDDDRLDSENEGDGEDSEDTADSASSLTFSSNRRKVKRKGKKGRQTKKIKLAKKKQSHKRQKGSSKTSYSVFDDDDDDEE